MVRQYDPDAIPSVYRLEDVPARESDGVAQRFFRGLDTMLGVTRVDPGRVSDRHAHPWEQLVYVLEGACTFHVGEATFEVAAGDAFWVPPGVEHGADGISASEASGGSSDERSESDGGEPSASGRTSSDERSESDGDESACTLLFCGPLREDVLEHTDYQAEFPAAGPQGRASASREG